MAAKRVTKSKHTTDWTDDNESKYRNFAKVQTTNALTDNNIADMLRKSGKWLEQHEPEVQTFRNGMAEP